MLLGRTFRVQHRHRLHHRQANDRARCLAAGRGDAVAREGEFDRSADHTLRIDERAVAIEYGEAAHRACSISAASAVLPSARKAAIAPAASLACLFWPSFAVP